MTKHNDLDLKNPHHTKNGFKNSEPFTIKMRDVRRWHKERKILPPKSGYQNFRQMWCTTIDLSVTGDQIWWLGHATTLIRLNGMMILTDPVFSERVSPVQFAGPKRRTPPALKIEALPHINVIVISHNHYDHLDFLSIKKLLIRFPDITVLVPLGLRDKIIKWGAKQVFELDWWQKKEINHIVFCAVPAKHWSRRELFDINKTLWCGWVIQSQQKTVYFMGDTGYSPILKTIGQHFPSIDLALIPIGAYAPRWFMQSQHIDPQQALQLFDELNCKSAVSIHWGAFELADESLDEPPQLLNLLKGSKNFVTLKIGANKSIDK